MSQWPNFWELIKESILLNEAMDFFAILNYWGDWKNNWGVGILPYTIKWGNGNNNWGIGIFPISIKWVVEW